MKLTDTAIRKAKPTDKPYKLFDGRGLYIEIPPTGSKRWRCKYRVDGREKKLALGTYPDVSLADARERHSQARKLLASGVDPGEHRNATKAARAESVANSFEVIAREWLAIKKKEWVESHYDKQIARMDKHIFPYIGKKPITDINVGDLRPILDRIANKGHSEQARRVLTIISTVLKYARATERATGNPAEDLGILLPARNKRRFATITDPQEIGKLLRAMDGYTGSPITIAALKLAPLTFVRPGELRSARWKDFEWDYADGARWVIPPALRKLRKAAKEDPQTEPHIVPLSTQAVAILRELQPLTGHREYVFPGVRDPKRPMSNNTVNGALRNLGYTGDDIVGHGFRHMASTILNEMEFNPDAIECQMAHKGKGVRAVYNLAKYFPMRMQMMQEWADYLDRLRAGAIVIPFKARAA